MACVSNLGKQDVSNPLTSTFNDMKDPEQRKLQRERGKKLYINRLCTLVDDEIFIKVPAFTSIEILGIHMTTMKDTWVKTTMKEMEKIPWDFVSFLKEIPASDIVKKEDTW